MKTIFIIPGYQHSPTDKHHKWMITAFKKKGFNVVPVHITWKYRTIEHWTREFKEVYEKKKTEKNYVLGFSFGAMIALLSANDVHLNKLFLCSLSPYFREDYKVFASKNIKSLGKKRLEAFRKYSARKVAKETPLPTIVFCGEKEGEKYPQLKKRCAETAELLPKGKLVMVKDAFHDISDPNYKKAILTNI